jgi:chromate reductase
MSLAREETAMDDPQTIKVLGFAGSLCKGSYNRMALRAAEQLLPDAVMLAIFDITPIPPHNEDVPDSSRPPSRSSAKR